MTHAADLRRIADTQFGPTKPQRVTIRQAAAALDAREWVKCSERLPPDMRVVLGYSSRFCHIPAQHFDGSWHHIGMEPGDKITHWQHLPTAPLPEPPRD